MAEVIRLSELTTLGLGGTPWRYHRPTGVPQLQAALADCRRLGLSWRVLGGGSNVLVEDGQLPYAVIHISAPGFARLERAPGCVVRAGAGVRTPRLLAFCRRHGLGGLEFLAGLPGTVGGAVAGNAGAWGQDVSGRLRRVWLVEPDGTHRQLPRQAIEFSYRGARLEGAVVGEAEFALKPKDPRLITLQMARCRRARAERHPIGEASAGCVFKNPPGCPAGALLDRCGLKGRRVGGAQVSDRHANFILNRGGASAGDVLALVQVMREAVRREFGVELEMEVRHWPSDQKAA
jgi:UDP-N-acetylmuramate dehydrogenase